MSEYKEGLHLIPDHMRGGVTRYIDGGLPHMGGFLRAVMENNFLEAFARADEANTECMKGWAHFIYMYAPAGCHGSPERVAEWIERGGLHGVENAAFGEAESAPLLQAERSDAAPTPLSE